MRVTGGTRSPHVRSISQSDGAGARSKEEGIAYTLTAEDSTVAGNMTSASEYDWACDDNMR
jgi:hypothetical protein